ncbi:hypothetical protein CROQUDRAFT_105997, partial [Cronartium quercuum f. sp. fusiforme G11]
MTSHTWEVILPRFGADSGKNQRINLNLTLNIHLGRSENQNSENPVPYGTKQGRGFGFLPDFKHESEVGFPTPKSMYKSGFKLPPHAALGPSSKRDPVARQSPQVEARSITKRVPRPGIGSSLQVDQDKYTKDAFKARLNTK